MFDKKREKKIFVCGNSKFCEDERQNVFVFVMKFLKVNQFMTGRVLKYMQIDPKKIPFIAKNPNLNAATVWDSGIAQGDEKYKGMMVCRNCLKT